MVIAVMTFIFSHEGDVMLPLKNLMSQKEGKKKRYFCLCRMTLALQERKDVFLLVSVPAILATGSTQDLNLASPVSFHKALELQKSFP